MEDIIQRIVLTVSSNIAEIMGRDAAAIKESTASTAAAGAEMSNLTGKATASAEALNRMGSAAATTGASVKRALGQEAAAASEALAVAIRSGDTELDGLVARSKAANLAVSEFAKAEKTAAAMTLADADAKKVASREMATFSETMRVGSERMRLFDTSLIGSKDSLVLFAAVLGGEAMKKALDFGEHLQVIGGNTGMTTQQVAAMREEVVKLGAQGPIALNDIADGFEKASNMMFQGADRTTLVTVAWKAAIATGGNVTDMVNLVGTAMRNMHEPMANAAVDMGMFMRGAAEGNVRLPDLANNFSKVNVVMSAMHQPLSEQIAAMATLTRSNHDAAMSQTILAGAATHILNPTKAAVTVMNELKQATGIDLQTAFAETAKGQMKFSDLMKLAREATKGHNDQLMTLFGGIRGGQAALVLAGQHWQDYNKTLKDVGQSSNLLQQEFEAMMKEPSAQLKTLGNDATIAALAIGDKLVPVIMEVVKDTAGFVSGVGDAANVLKNFIPDINGLGTALGVIVPKLIEGALLWKGLKLAISMGQTLNEVRVGLLAAGLAAETSGNEAEVASIKYRALGTAMKAATVIGLGLMALDYAKSDSAQRAVKFADQLAQGLHQGKITLDQLNQGVQHLPADFRDVVIQQLKVDGVWDKINHRIAEHNRLLAATKAGYKDLPGSLSAPGAPGSASTTAAAATASAASTDPQKAYQAAMTAVTKAQYAQAQAIVNGTATAGQFNAQLDSATKTADKWTKALQAVQNPTNGDWHSMDPQKEYQASMKALTEAQYAAAQMVVHGQKATYDQTQAIKTNQATVDKWTKALDQYGAKHQKVVTDATTAISNHQKILSDAQARAALDVIKFGYVTAGTADKLANAYAWSDKLAAAQDAIQHPMAQQQAGDTRVIAELQHQSNLIGLNVSLSQTERALQQAQLQVQIDQRQISLDQSKYLELIATHAPPSQVTAASQTVSNDRNKLSEDRLAAVNAAQANTNAILDRQAQIAEAGFSSQIEQLRHQSAMAQMQLGLTADQKSAIMLGYQVQMDLKQIALDQLKLDAAYRSKDKVAIAQAQNAVSADQNKYQEDRAAKGQADQFVLVDAIVKAIVQRESGITAAIATNQHRSAMTGLNVSLSPADRAIAQAHLQVSTDNKQINLDRLKLEALLKDPRSTPDQIAAARQQISNDQNKKIEDQKNLSNLQAATHTLAGLTQQADFLKQQFLDTGKGLAAFVAAFQQSTAAANANNLRLIQADMATGQFIEAAKIAAQAYTEGKMSLAAYVAIQQKANAQTDHQTWRTMKADEALGNWSQAVSEATTLYDKGKLSLAAFIKVIDEANKNADKIEKRTLRGQEGTGDWQGAVQTATDLFKKGKISADEFANVLNHADQQTQKFNAGMEEIDEQRGKWIDAAALARQAYLDGTMSLEDYTRVQRRANQQADEQTAKSEKAAAALGDWAGALPLATEMYHKGAMSFGEFIGVLDNANKAAAANAAKDWAAAYAVGDLATKSSMLAQRFSVLVSQQSTVANAQAAVDSATNSLLTAQGAVEIQKLQDIVTVLGDMDAIASAQAAVATASFNIQLAAIKDQSAIRTAIGQAGLATNAQLQVIAQDQLVGDTQKLALDTKLLNAIIATGRDDVAIAVMTYQMDRAVGEAQLRVALLQQKMAMDKLQVDQANQAAAGKVALDNVKVAEAQLAIAKDNQKLALLQLGTQVTIAELLAKGFGLDDPNVAKYGNALNGLLGQLSADQGAASRAQAQLTQDTIAQNTTAAQGSGTLARDQSSINSAQNAATAVQQFYQLQLAALEAQKANDTLRQQQIQQELSQLQQANQSLTQINAALTLQNQQNAEMLAIYRDTGWRDLSGGRGADDLVPGMAASIRANVNRP